ncbi:MAG: type II secretion system F family protein [Planctomycetota bacterium]|nr:MAG: type II secretion system F family protein [Planctomycetota bacterium]
MAAAAAPDLGLGYFKPRIADPVHDKIKLSDKLAFFRQLNTLFRAGTPLYQAVMIAAEQSESKQMRKVIQAIGERIAAGDRLSEALAAWPEHFKPEWTQLVRSGEVSGQLGEVLMRLAATIDEAAQFRSKIVSALMYPCIVLGVSTSAVIVMLVFVVPTFASMFEDMGKELPDLTIKVLAASDFLRERGHWLLLGLIGAFYAFRQYIRGEDGSRVWTKFLISMPLSGDLMVQTAMQTFSQNLASLLQSGVPLLESMDALKGIFGRNPVYRAAMKRLAQHIGRGGNLADGMAVTGVFTSFSINMTRIGEESGTLPEVHAEVAEFYKRKVEVVVTRIASNIETVLIVLMGLAVALILTALYLPLFEMAT